MLISETRCGGNAPGLPGLPPPTLLPSLPEAFSRRRAVFGPVEANMPVAENFGATCAENTDLAAARALHARRMLEQALDHGTALLAVLGLPRFVDDGFVPVDRDAAGEALTAAVALLDAIDPDPDLEPSLGAPENHEPTTVRVAPWTWGQLPPDQRRWAQGMDDGREEDVADEPHGDDTDAEETLGWAANIRQLALGPNTADGDVTAPERHGKGFVRCGPDDAEDGHDAEDERDGGTDDGEDASHHSGRLVFRSRPHQADEALHA